MSPIPLRPPKGLGNPKNSENMSSALLGLNRNVVGPPAPPQNHRHLVAAPRSTPPHHTDHTQLASVDHSRPVSQIKLGKEKPPNPTPKNLKIRNFLNINQITDCQPFRLNLEQPTYSKLKNLEKKWQLKQYNTKFE